MPSFAGPSASHVGEVWRLQSVKSMLAESDASTSSVPGCTDPQLLIPNVGNISIDTPVSVGEAFPVSDLLDAAGGGHVDGGMSSVSVPYVTGPIPSNPDVDQLSVGASTDKLDDFYPFEPSDIAGGSHLDSVDEPLPLADPMDDFLPGGDFPGGGDLHADNFNIDLDAIAFIEDP
ncbi:hypothetical protein EI94DRAFT_1812918 [Lactarius quietus]|nr:hypothetical protein EI94DRAFT_1812918 [Lactarius quietus]